MSVRRLKCGSFSPNDQVLHLASVLAGATRSVDDEGIMRMVGFLSIMSIIWYLHEDPNMEFLLPKNVEERGRDVKTAMSAAKRRRIKV